MTTDALSATCRRCQRHTWDPAQFGKEDRMEQSDGFPCGGMFTDGEPNLIRPSAQEVLDLALPPNDSEASTVRGYLITLLSVIWTDGGDLKPFGNSGWQNDIYIPMVRAGWISGEFIDDYYVKKIDHVAGDALIGTAIRRLGKTS